MPEVTDTSPEIERMVRNQIMARSAEERFIMGAEAFDSAREKRKRDACCSNASMERNST
jgi:hypothetical protein